MFLSDLQSMLARIYALEVSYDIHDFLITDRRLAQALDGDGRSVDEKLLIDEGESEPRVSLYLEKELLERLRRNDPMSRLDGDNIADFWTAFEGVSHFTYYAWNAMVEKSVTLLEMELQAEVDKFVATALLLGSQGEKPPAGLHHWLFDMPRLDERLTDAERRRYVQANQLAARYCLKLVPRLSGGVAGEDLKRELRYFYRLPQPGKLEHIEAS
jgi:hypothetical protein